MDAVRAVRLRKGSAEGRKSIQVDGTTKSGRRLSSDGRCLMPLPVGQSWKRVIGHGRSSCPVLTASGLHSLLLMILLSFWACFHALCLPLFLRLFSALRLCLMITGRIGPHALSQSQIFLPPPAARTTAGGKFCSLGIKKEGSFIHINTFYSVSSAMHARLAIPSRCAFLFISTLGERNHSLPDPEISHGKD